MKRNRVLAGRKILVLAAVIFLISGIAAGCTSQEGDAAARIMFVSKADYDPQDFVYVGIKVFDGATGSLLVERVFTDDPDFDSYLQPCSLAYQSQGIPCVLANDLLDLPPLTVPTGEDRRFVATIFVWDKITPNKLNFYEGTRTNVDVLSATVDVSINATAPSSLSTIRGRLCADAGCAQTRDYGAIFVRDRDTGVELPAFNAFCTGTAPPAADTLECDPGALDGGYYRIDLPPGRVYEVSAMLNGLNNSMAPTPIYAEAGRRTAAPIAVTPPNGTLDLFATAEPEGGRGTLSGNIQHTASAQTSPFQGVEVRVGSPTFDTNNDPMDKIVFQQTAITDTAGSYSISPTPQVPVGNHPLEIVFLPTGTIHPTLTSVQINSGANGLSGTFTAAQLSNRAVDPVATFPAAIVAGDTLGGGGLSVQVVDNDLDTTGAPDTLAATITNNTTGESEGAILTETGNTTGVFQLGTGLLTVGGLVGGTDNDGTLVIRSGNPVQMTFTDPITFNGDTAVPISVPPVTVGNRAPVLAAIANITVGQGGPVSAPQVTASDLDTTDTLTFAVLNKPAWLLFTDNGDGTLDWSGTGPGTPGTFNITVQVTDSGTPAASDTQAVTVTVVPNQAPTLGTNSGLVVAESAAGIIVSAALLYNDADNGAAQLTYTLVTPPLYGQVRLGGSPLGVSGTFTQADVNTNQVDYLHDGTDGQPSDSFGFSLSDGINTIFGQTFAFSITPVDDAPVLATNAGKTVAEGSTGNGIFSAELLTADVDTVVGSLVYTVTAVPANGTLRISGTPAIITSTFTQAQINGGQITYDHDASETTSDSFGFTVSDGTTLLTGNTFNITVTAVDDPPVLSTNNPATVNEGSAGNVIDNSNLAITDVDTLPASRWFILTAIPVNGTLRLAGTPQNVSDIITNTQFGAGNVTYDHDGSETASDSFSFNIYDGTSTLGPYTFNVTVTPADDPPTLGINTGTTVNEGSLGSVIANTELSISDLDSGSNLLVYTLTAGPANGTLRQSGTPLSAAMTFLQSNVDSGVLTYDHDDSQTTSDSFSFTIEDAVSGPLGPFTFNITVTSVNDAPSIAVNNTLPTSAGQATVVTTLSTSDPDNTPTELVYTLDSVPTDGDILLASVPLLLGQTFTQQDILDFNVAYQNTGNVPTSDGFNFTVCDLEPLCDTGVFAISVSADSPAQLGFATAPQTVTAGACSPLVTVQSQDTFGNPSNVGSLTIVDLSGTPAYFAAGDTTCIGANITQVTISPGGNSAQFRFKTTVSGTPLITASDNGAVLTAANQSQTVNHDIPDHLSFGTLPPVSIAAGAFWPSLTVELRDQFENLINDDNTTQVTLNHGGSGTLSVATSLTKTVVNGIAGWSNGIDDLWYNVAETINLGATSDLGPVIDSTAPVIVTPDVAYQLDIDPGFGPPASVVAGNIWPEIRIRIEDLYGNLVNDNSTLIGMNNISTGTLDGGTLARTAANGVAAFNDLSHNTAVSIAYDFDSSPILDITLTTGLGTTIVHAAADHLVFQGGPPPSVTAAATWATFTVQIEDVFGNVVDTGVDSTRNVILSHFYPSPLGGNATRAAVAGVATFDDITQTLAGTMSLSPCTGPSCPGSSDLIQPSPQTVVIDPDVADHLAFGFAPPAKAQASIPWSFFTVEARDFYENVDTLSSPFGIQIQFQGGGNPLWYGTSFKNTVNGVAVFDDLYYPISKTLPLEAGSGGFPSPLPFTVQVDPNPYAFEFNAVERMSVRTDGSEGGVSLINHQPSMSRDGRYVAFRSGAGLEPPDTDVEGFGDIYVRDVVLRTTKLVSLQDPSAGSGKGNGSSTDPSISGDGRFVAFGSLADNLVVGDTNGRDDIFVRDVFGGTTERVSVQNGGVEATSGPAGSFFPEISADGRYVAFHSAMTDLLGAGNDTNGVDDVFVHDRFTKSTVRVSVDVSGTQANSWSMNAAVSADGRFVAFVSGANNLNGLDSNAFADVFVHDRDADGNGVFDEIPGGVATALASLDSFAGVANNNSGMGGLSISGDGRFVTFSSDATNLVSADFNGVEDVFLHDMLSGKTRRLSADEFGNEAVGGWSSDPVISFDGSWVTFTSLASNLGTVSGFDEIGTGDGITPNFSGTLSQTPVAPGSVRVEAESRVCWDDGLGSLSCSPGGSGSIIYAAGSISVNFATAPAIGVKVFADYRANNDTNGFEDVFVYTLIGDQLHRVTSKDNAPYELNGASFEAALSVLGKSARIAFTSEATDILEPGEDNNLSQDVFVFSTFLGLKDEFNNLERVSKSSVGVEANLDNVNPAVASNGEFLAFESIASNLVPNDLNGARDIFVYDTDKETVERVNIDSAGTEASGGQSYRPALSSDGRYVAFDSEATNLVTPDPNGASDVFVYDRAADTVERMSEDAAGTQAGNGSWAPSISIDGRFVAFESAEDNYSGVPDANGFADIYVKDRKTKAIERVSIDSSETSSNGASGSPSISADGRYVAFFSDSTDLVAGDSNSAIDVFVRDRFAGTTVRVSVNSAGVEGNGPSSVPRISGDGRFVAFVSQATNLGDLNGSPDDVFVHDLVTGVTEWISQATDGSSSAGVSAGPAISGDGRYVTFFTGGVFDVSRDGNLTTDVYARDRLGRTTSLVSLRQDNTQAGDLPSDLSTMTSDGKVIVFQSNATDLLGPGNDSNNSYDIFVRRNPATDSFPSGGVPNEIASRQDASLGNGESDSQTDTGAVSEDGRFVAFSTYASNLETPDLDSGLDQDVFVRDRLTNRTVYVSYDTASTVQGNGQSYDPAISADGRYVVYSSTASNLLPGDSGTFTDIYLFDLLARRTERISVGIGGAEPNGENYDPEISPDGRFVVFESFAGNLAPNDANADNDVYLYDRVAGTTTLVSADMAGNAAGSSLEPVVSYDGRYVAFKSQNGGIVPGDANGAYDVFAWDRIADQTERVSLRDPSAGGGETLAGAAHNPSISWDGTIVAFESLAGDMIASGTTPGRRHVYLHDRVTLSTVLASRTVSGAEAGGDSFFPSLSGDGTLVAFETSSDLLDGGDVNGFPDIYVSDLLSLDVARVSIDSAEPNGGSNGPAMSASGRYIAFRTDATNVAGTDTNGAADFAIVPNPLPSPLFQTRPPVTAVNGPQAVALGDMDRDGRVDAVVVFSSAASGQVFYGDGMGNLSAGPTFAATGDPRGVVLADFDRDGDLDIAISSNFSGSIELARNDGGGTFTGVAGPAIAGNPWGITTADFDRDGRVDIVVARETSNTVEIFQNQGGMTFASVNNFALGGSVTGAARDVVAGDFDRDGKMDFAATNGNTMDQVEVYLGNGAFGFAAAPFSPFTTGGDPNELEAADFDGDGVLDLAITNGFDGNVTVVYGDGTGAFVNGPSNTFPTGAGPYALAAGDFDKDGYPDLATTGQSSNDVSIRLGFANSPPSGTQDPDTPYLVGNNPVSLATADLDQDGALDLVLVEQSADGLRVLLNTTPSDPPPSYAPAANYLTDSAPVDAALGDFNRDGKMDVAVACNLGFDSRVSFGNGSGGLVLGPQLAVPSFPLSIAAADMDNDGDLDVLTGVDASEIRTHLNDGTGAFSPAGTWTGITGACSLCYPHYLLTADFNRDGDMDVAAVLQDDSMIAIFMGDGSGSGSYTQQADVVLPGGTNPGRFAAADLDRDGILDLVIPGVLNGQIYAYKGDGLSSPGFTPFAAPFTAGDPRAVAIADLDGDGKLDLAVASGSGTGVYVFLGDGTGNFGPSSNYGAGNGFGDVVAVDADQDGDLDLFAARFTTDGLQPLYNDGSGVFSVGTFVSGLADPRKVLAVDLNRDGRPDAITPSNGGGMISVFLEQ